MRQLLGNAELLRHKNPVLFQLLEAADEIGEQISVRINKPIQLIAVRRRVNASAAAVLDPVHKLLKCHFIFELQSLIPFIKRDDAVPRVANKSELEVGLELLASDFPSALFWK